MIVINAVRVWSILSPADVRSEMVVERSSIGLSVLLIFLPVDVGFEIRSEIGLLGQIEPTWQFLLGFIGVPIGQLKSLAIR